MSKSIDQYTTEAPKSGGGLRVKYDENCMPKYQCEYKDTRLCNEKQTLRDMKKIMLRVGFEPATFRGFIHLSLLHANRVTDIAGK